MEDGNPPWIHGEFSTWEEAAAAVRAIVERSLEEVHSPTGDPEELFRLYTTFGEDAFIDPPIEGRVFSAWEYARERCREICAAAD